MKKNNSIVFPFVLAICLIMASAVLAEDLPVSSEQTSEALNISTNPDLNSGNYDEDIYLGDLEFQPVIIKDPIESYNRSMFLFNDMMYYHVIKPANKGYNFAVPEKAKTSVRKFFINIFFPGRFLNCLFQGKLAGAGTELARFVINSSIGLAGFFDPAEKLLNLKIQNEDFGQTLAKYGMGHGSYIVWPFVGPSSTRDTLGFIGDVAMNPLTVVSFFITPFASLGRPYDTFNSFALDEGELYESVVEASIDPYIAIQDAYIQNRSKKIEE